MRTFPFSVLALMLLSACDGNPFETDPVDGGGGSSDFVLTGTTTNATRGGAITRVENRDDAGSGYAEDMAYDEVNDVFLVDNLAFDGENVYLRDAGYTTSGPAGTLEGTGVSIFKGDEFAVDGDGDVVDQFTYRALYGVSSSGETEFAIVRTGDYQGYGFGGFLYQRNGGVTIPVSGQASFQGDYSGIRDFSGSDQIPGGIEYVTGQIIIDIDFSDFNDADGMIGDGVSGYVFDREVFDINGTNVTQDILDALNAEDGAVTTLTEMPVLYFTIGPGVMTDAGEISSGVSSDDATRSVYESGTYYAVLSGDGVTEIVGIIVVESEEMRNDVDGVTVRETGGFIVYN